MYRASEHRHHNQHRCERDVAPLRQQLMMEQPEARGDEDCREQYKAVPPKQAAGSREQDFAEPFLCHGGSVVCVQEYILVNDYAVLDYPLAEPTMESRVTVSAE